MRIDPIVASVLASFQPSAVIARQPIGIHSLAPDMAATTNTNHVQPSAMIARQPIGNHALAPDMAATTNTNNGEEEEDEAQSGAANSTLYRPRRRSFTQTRYVSKQTTA